MDMKQWKKIFDLFEKPDKNHFQSRLSVDIRAGNGNNTSIIMKDKAQEIKHWNPNSIRIRVLNHGAWGFAYTNDLSKLFEIVINIYKNIKILKEMNILQSRHNPGTKYLLMLKHSLFSDVSEEKKEYVQPAKLLL